MTTSGTNDNLKVKRGDKLSAKRWNRIVDRLSENEHGTGTTVGTLHQDIVFGKAIADVALGEVRGLGDFYGDPDAVFDIGDGDIVELALPTWPDTCHMLLVPRQPIESDEIGPCVYAGGAVVRFREETEQPVGNYCFPDPVDPTYMKKSTSGYKIATVVSDDYAVAVMSDVQQVWKFELTQTYTSGPTAAAKLLTLLDEEFATSVYVKMLSCGALPTGTVGYCIFAQGDFHLVEICQGGGGGVDNPRVRFRLLDGFNDTGTANALVLNTYGTTNVSPGDTVTVCDTQKQFAKAIGANDVSVVPSTVFPCGGSIGFAVETTEILGSCTIEGSCSDGFTAANCTASNGSFNAGKNCDDSDIAPEVRWEVEQCSQTLNKMLVSVYINDSTHSQPTGEIGEGKVTLYFNDHESFLSRWPNVDYDTAIENNFDGTIPYNYKIEADNDGHFSAINGSLVSIQAAPKKQRILDGCNVDTPYTTQNPESDRWQIEEVHSPIARYIKCSWRGLDPTDPDHDEWEYDHYYEGDDPEFYFIAPDEVSKHIETLPGFEQTCLKEGEKGFAFWDMNDQTYKVFATRSAMYGTGTSFEMVGQPTAEEDEILAFSGCDLNFKVSKPWFVFGDGKDCESDYEFESTSPALLPVDNIYNVTRVGDQLHFDYNTVYVCAFDPGGIKPVEICCDDETGCCREYDGTYTPDQTQEDCTNRGGQYLGDGSECPDPPDCLVECSECTNGGAAFNLDGLSWSGQQTGSGQAGHADISTQQWTAIEDCCAELEVVLESDDPNVNPVTATAQVCIVQPNNCTQPMMLELELSWQPATFDGVTLPTVLGAGQVTGCGGTYGLTGGCIVPDQPDPNTPSGTWDECDITVTDCTI